ncbi:MAG: ECF-type sigma factor [Planctomycetota bacterium]
MHGPITQALDAIREGEVRAQNRLFELVKGELDAMAHRSLARESPGHGLQTTGLVDEAYMKLLGGTAGASGLGTVSFENRRHFFGAAAEAVRRILIDHARSMSAEKRGGRMGRAGIDLESLPAAETRAGDWEALGEALARLEAKDARAAEVVRLRFFAGLSEVQAAEVLGVTDRTVRRDWVFAKAWLAAEMKT